MRHASPTGSIAEKIWKKCGVSNCFYSKVTTARRLTTEYLLVRGHIVATGFCPVTWQASSHRIWSPRIEKGPERRTRDGP